MSIKQISIEKEYEKNPEILPNDIKALREWLNTQPHLPSELITDLDLILAYHCCQRSSEVTKQILDLNYTLRTELEFYNNRDVSSCSFRTWLMTPLAEPSNQGNKIIYCQLLDPDPKKFNHFELSKEFSMVIDLCQFEEGTTPGIAVVANIDNLSWSHVTRLDIKLVHQFFKFLQEAIFFQLKEFHFFNTPSFMDKLYNMYKPFVSNNVLEMVRIHPTGSNSLDQFVLRSVLPKDVGGDYKDSVTLRDEVLTKMNANKQFFNEELKKRVDESKRPANSMRETNFGSVVGTFKTLDID